ncbi:1-acyl-sn-glycerol-3-phosphate acyltransferase [Gordonia jinghuaiqii]|uniref:1-acyl-sn-glycerol-3-phosphate acyltransferase n=1 Tax=Gordonia jinghuaiqii TaxID=2758710 RepID=A0A7D7QYJ4_9ACTN|nr:lysophospholipid acyltransferase family protein [Gordonia jinghuaiqii]MCR5977017.1 1-acyl-sn-glycerol-3-phosphate acyltransferase [Gordonia jinghuaiqii]QMT00371.1 1-acyl-sn-glycerol-3-phosphate acyltransferase [Gordonia jinghuaiqii]
MTALLAGPVATLHPWFPVSTCGEPCIGPRVSRRFVAVAEASIVAWRLCRLLTVVVWIVWAALTAGLGARARRRPARALRGRASRALLGALGIAVDIDDRRPDPAAAGLVVANHISFLDVLALAAVSPAHVVAKSDVVDIPVASSLAGRFGVITVDRHALRSLPATVGQVAGRLTGGDPVIVFPEGTTYCGRTGGTFRPAFFQAAIDAGVPVFPVGLCFRGVDGTTATAPSFIGADTPVDTLRRVLRARGLTLGVRVHPAEPPGADRRELARRCERVVSGDTARQESDITRSLI